MGGGIQTCGQPVSAPVVSNSSPLIALEQIGQLHLLEALFGEVWVPTAVVNEVAMTVSLPSNVQTRPVNNLLAAAVLKTTLGGGESEAITLALQEKARLIILDDRPARRMAESLGLQVIGTLGLLTTAKKRGLISAIKPFIDALDTHHFHVAPELIRRVLLDAGELP
jgi:predicted nucleic acid-binding protein